MKPVTKIRSLGFIKVNKLVRAARRLEELTPAFEDWASGEIYVCKKTGDYRYRFGDRSKSVAPWNAVAREMFAGPEELAFAAMVLIRDQVVPKLQSNTAKLQPGAATSSRANIIALASASEEAA
jgi:hypothetical protein